MLNARIFAATEVPWVDDLEGRWDEALPLHQEAYELVLRVRGAEHRDTAAVMKTLALRSRNDGPRR